MNVPGLFSQKSIICECGGRRRIWLGVFPIRIWLICQQSGTGIRFCDISIDRFFVPRPIIVRLTYVPMGRMLTLLH